MDPQIEQVAPGVLRFPLRTPTLPPATTTNTCIVVGDTVAVIEPATPHPDERARLDALLAELAAAGHPLALILLTHHHVDHIGYAAELRERHGVPIAAHPETTARVPFAIDRSLDDGERIELGGGVTLRAVFTPGHAPGHLVYLEQRSAVAYVGDMLAGEGTILIDPLDSGDMTDYLASLARIDALGAAALVPSHGPVLRDPPAAIAQYIAHRLAREAKVVAALEGGALPWGELLARAYADTPELLWPIAERSLEAHVRKLVAEQRVDRDGATLSLRVRPSEA
jgi:endoribonuclease LACTB2